MKQVIQRVENAQNLFRTKIKELVTEGGITREGYVRFLSMQFHLTKGVQRHFFIVASHSDMAEMRALRAWLIKFAQEEEFHFQLALNDLSKLDVAPMPMPFDLNLWWLYFNSVVYDRPFVRLGATCILENIADNASDLIDGMISRSDFLTIQNLTFLAVHRHGPNLAHGEEIIKVLSSARLNDRQLEDISEGARLATIIYMRLLSWVITGEELR